MQRIVILVALGALCIQANAQNKSGAGVQNAALVMNNAIEISFTGNSSAVNIEFMSLNDLLNGVETAEHEVRVRSNKKFKVTVKAASNNMTYSGAGLLGNLLKVSNVMRVKVVDNNTGGTQPWLAQLLGWQSFNSWGIPVTLLNNCDPGGDQTFTVKYKAIPGINLVAGTYTAEMVYTATQL